MPALALHPSLAYPRDRAAMVTQQRQQAAQAALRARRNAKTAGSALQRATWVHLMRHRLQELQYWNHYSRTFCYRRATA